MDQHKKVVSPQLESIFRPQLELLEAQTFSVPFGVAARLDGPIATGWFWGYTLDEDCLVTTMHMVAHRAFTLVERPVVDYSVLGLLSSSDTGLINTMRVARKAADPTDPFSGGFSPTLPRNALAFSMQAGRREFEMPAGSLHDSTNICMLPSFVARMQHTLSEEAPNLADAFARGVELNASPHLLKTLRSIDPTSLAHVGAPLHYRALVYDAIAQLATRLAEQDRPRVRRATLGGPGIEEAVNAALLSSLAAPPTLDELAEHLYMGRTRLCEIFRAEAGVSIGERLAELRVAEAQRRLTRGDEPIADIARAVGYAHTGSFTTMFRQHTGLTPSAWRRQAVH